MDDLNSDLFEDPILDDDNTLLDFEPAGGDDERKSGGGNRTFMIAVGALVAVFLVGLITLVALVSMTQPGRNQARQEEIAQINAANTAAAATATSFTVAGGVQGTLEAVAAAASPTNALVLPEATATKEASGLSPAATEPPLSAASPTMVVVENTATLPPIATETLSPAEALSGNPDARTATVQFLLTLSAGGGEVATEVAPGDPAASTPVVQSEAMTATAYAYQATASGSTTTTLPNTGFWDEVGIPVLLGGAVLLVFVIILVRRLRLSN